MISNSSHTIGTNIERVGLPSSMSSSSSRMPSTPL